LRFLAALHQHGGDTVEAVELGLQVVGRHRPQSRLRDGVRGQAVAEDGEAGEGKAVAFDGGGGRKLALHLGQGGVDQLQGGDHVDLPVEVEVNLGRAAAGDGGDLLQAGNAVDGFFEGAGDGDHHLVNGHHAVVHADDDTGEVGLREDGDGQGEGEIAADQGEGDDEEDQGAGEGFDPGGAAANFFAGRFHRSAHGCGSPAGAAGAAETMVTLELSASA